MQLLRPEWVWTADGLRTGWCVGVDAGTIVDLGPASRHHRFDRDLPGCLLMPALVNAHSHAFQRAFRGQVQWRAAGEDDFWSWREAMYDVAGRLDPEGVEAVSRLAFLEMAESGIGAVGEFHYLHHQPDGTPYADPDELARRVIAAARDVGLRIALLRVAYARNGPGQPLQPKQRRFGAGDPEEVLAAIQRLRGIADEGVTIGLAPHSIRAVPADWLPALAAFDGPVHAHVAEQPAEVARCLEEHGRHPLEVFADAGLVTSRFTAVHLTHPGPRDAGILRDADASICVCPGTELDLGDGFLPLEAREGTRLCLGSDSHATIDLLAESRALELHARALAGRRNVMAPVGERHGLAERLLRAATTAGARALGLDARGLTVGAPADLLALDLDRPAAAGVPPLEAAAFVATPEWIEEVWVLGRPIVAGGAHPDRERVVEAARPYLER